ncbi:MAG: NAD(P)/FAD-dependent oxidoreductase [Sphaerobacteraceae bacterium]|nr:MAG: NAD(P)/FAD-dependent oxidoreductase [Sphaerobacteraceae bacterium]
MADVIIVGGSYAGMAAALQLARGRRDVVVLDEGIRRNRFAAHSHGVLGQDGRDPADFAQEARSQLLKYPNVTWINEPATGVETVEDGFVIRTGDATTIWGKRLILATGVRDGLPEIHGLQERWGKAVFHCPYCHGYELEQGPLGVLAIGEISLHQALLIPEWGSTTFFTNGRFEPNDQQLQQLKSRNVRLESERVVEISGSGPGATVHLRDGRKIELAGLFVASMVNASCPIVEQLACEMTETPLGSIIQTSEMKETSIPNVFACGDATRAAGNLTMAMADGVLAGSAAHRSLVFDGLS